VDEGAQPRDAVIVESFKGGDAAAVFQVPHDQPLLRGDPVFIFHFSSFLSVFQDIVRPDRAAVFLFGRKGLGCRFAVGKGRAVKPFPTHGTDGTESIYI
jgi:hypothetical protein